MHRNLWRYPKRAPKIFKAFRKGHMKDNLRGTSVSKQVVNRVPNKGNVRYGLQEDYITYKKWRNKTVEWPICAVEIV